MFVEFCHKRFHSVKNCVGTDDDCSFTNGNVSIFQFFYEKVKSFKLILKLFSFVNSLNQHNSDEWFCIFVILTNLLDMHLEKIVVCFFKNIGRIIAKT